jgi:hypothetical protein
MTTNRTLPDKFYDIKWMQKQLSTKSASQVARENGARRSSVQWVIDRYLPAGFPIIKERKRGAVCLKTWNYDIKNEVRSKVCSGPRCIDNSAN